MWVRRDWSAGLKGVVVCQLTNSNTHLALCGEIECSKLSSTYVYPFEPNEVLLLPAIPSAVSFRLVLRFHLDSELACVVFYPLRTPITF